MLPHSKMPNARRVIIKDTKEPKEAKEAYVSLYSSTFRDFLLKAQLIRAIDECGFEHPSVAQHECIPQALLGVDILCQAKSGIGKTAVFVVATLQQLEPVDNEVHVLVLCNTRELALQIRHEYLRFSKYLTQVKVAAFIGGLPIQNDEYVLKNNCPHIVVGTPGRITALAAKRVLNLKHLKHFILDQCDQLLDVLELRYDVQQIFVKTPHDKQVMMFCATLSRSMRLLCKKFMYNPTEVCLDNTLEASLHSLQQYYIEIEENEKIRKLVELLQILKFDQLIVYVNTVNVCINLTNILTEKNFSALPIHRALSQIDRSSIYRQFKGFRTKILVSTNIFGRGMDFERVNIVVNFDVPSNYETYIHRVSGAVRFGTKGLAISFVTNVKEAFFFNSLQEKYETDITELEEEHLAKLLFKNNVL